LFYKHGDGQSGYYESEDVMARHGILRKKVDSLRKWFQPRGAVSSPMLETMEERLLLSTTLLGLQPQAPFLAYDHNGQLNYTAATQSLAITATPLSFQLDSSTPPAVAVGPGSLAINIQVDNDGNLIGGVSGDDLVIQGGIDLNGDGVADVSGTLLTGEIAAFGAEATGTNVAKYDFLFTPTGGQLASYYSGQELGIVMTSEHSTFTGDFHVDSSGGAKGNVGGVGFVAMPASLGDFVWHDMYHGPTHLVDGVQDAGEPGLTGVTVNLLNGSGNFLESTTTDASGYYFFGGLSPDTYIVEVAPANFQAGGSLEGWYATLQDQGNDATDSDGNPVTHRSGPVTLASGENNPTVDFGFFTTGIELTKTGSATVCPGGTITYHFTVTNTGDVVLHGGAHVYDALLNPCGSHEIWSSVMQPGDVVTFDKTYKLTCKDTGKVVNTAQAVGHPIGPNGTALDLVYDDASWTTQITSNSQKLSSIAGSVYVDSDNDGRQDRGERGISGVTIVLTGVDMYGNQVHCTTRSDCEGNYSFKNLLAGTYTVTEVQPGSYVDGKDSLGSLGGVLGNDKFSQIKLPGGTQAVDYDFGERLKTCHRPSWHFNCGSFICLDFSRLFGC
jgi:hypothetical protein